MGGGVTGLRVGVLGGVRVWRADTPVTVPGPRLRRLLTRLALDDGRAVDPRVLTDAIWGARPPADPGHAVQALVSRLRRLLGTEAVVRESQGYRLVAAAVDVAGFERQVVAGRERLRDDDAEAAAEAFAKALALWGERPGAEPAAIGEVAPGEANRLSRLSIELVVDLAEAQSRRGEFATAVTRLTDLLAEYPVHERAAAVAMDALAAQGRQAEALACYERIRAALAEELGADPGAALRQRHLRLLRTEPTAGVDRRGPIEEASRAGLTEQAGQTERAGRAETASSASRSGGPTPRPVAVPRDNLPAPVTDLIGRDEDLARIDALLATGRLATVVGPGGAGKTRLAIEAARRHRDDCRDGAWFVDLAAITVPAELAGAVTAAIGLRGSAVFDDAARPPSGHDSNLDLLVEQLTGRELLLVVDNCEHLIDAVAHLVAALLTRCAELRVLATSREPLAIDGEALVPLGPLTLPAAEADLDTARTTASVRLFTERAARLRPDFTVDHDNLATVLRIVRALDGLPLALELAAARLRTMTLPDLAAGLSDRFGLLTTGSRTADPRHRTLRAVIAWSWDLLEPALRTVAERIAVLTGGVTPDSAAAVCVDTPVTAQQIPELLADLVDRSLLQLSPGTGRYRMLETIREYGLQRLAAAAALDVTRDHAADHFTRLVAHNDPRLRGPEQLAALRSLRVEYDNVLAALRHRCDAADGDGAVGLAVLLTWYWQLLGLRRDAANWLSAAITAAADDPGVHRDIAEGLLLLGSIAPPSALINDFGETRHRRLAAVTRRLARHPRLPGFGGALLSIQLARLNDAAVDSTDVPPRPTALDARSAPQHDDGDTAVWLRGLDRLLRAQVAENQGRLDRARTDIATALDCFARTGDRWSQATTLPLRALLRQYDGDLDGAVADLTQARRLAREFGALSLGDELFIDLRWIDLRLRLGDIEQAVDIVTAMRQRVSRSATQELTVLLDAREADLRLRLGDTDRARELLAAAEAGLAQELALDDDRGHTLVEAVRAALCLELDDGPGAEAALRRAYAAGIDSRDMPIVATVAVIAADLAIHRGHPETAAAVLGAAARLRGGDDPTDPRLRRVTDACTAAIGLEAFATAYRSGRRLDATAALTRVDPSRISGSGPTGSV